MVRKVSVSRVSAVNARTSLTPDRFSCTRAEISANCAWIASKRRWMRSPKNQTVSDTSGRGSRL